MKNFLTTKQLKVILVAGLVLLIIYIVTWVIRGDDVPEITLTNPSDGSQGIAIYTQINYQFNQDVSLQDISFHFTPEVATTITQKSQGFLILTPKRTLQPATTYTIIPSWRGEKLPALSFTTQVTQTDPLLIENMKTELERDYPLGQKLPLNTSQYRVVYSSPLTLEITIKNPNLTSQEVIDEIKSWVTKNGADASTHKYVIK